jgi:immune inhibitor A
LAKRASYLTEFLLGVNSERMHARPLAVASLAMLLALAPAVAGAGARPVPTTGTLPLLVLLAGFPDRPLARPPAAFTDGDAAPVPRLVAYWREVSAGRLNVVPHVVPRVLRLPARRATYVNQPARMAADALAAFAAGDPDAAERAARDAAVGVLVFFAGAGRESHVDGGDPGDPWSNYAVLPDAPWGIGNAVVVAEEEVPPFANFGVLCHEMGHLLGLPELYATGGVPQEGIGVWGLMGQGTWIGKGDAPPFPEAWSRLRLGWADVETITAGRARVTLPAAETSPRIVRIAPAGGPPGEYWLLENRRRIGADARLPGEGVLVWHVDERAGGFRTAQNDLRRPLLRLVQADGREDLERGHRDGGNRGDADDPWQGPSRGRVLAAAGLGAVGVALVLAGILPLARPARAAVVLRRLVAGTLAVGVAAGLAASPVCGTDVPGMAPHDGGPGRVVVAGLGVPGDVTTATVTVTPVP